MNFIKGTLVVVGWLLFQTWLVWMLMDKGNQWFFLGVGWITVAMIPSIYIRKRYGLWDKKPAH